MPDEDASYLSRNLEVARHSKLLLHLFDIPKFATVLDFGGGLGIVARLLQESGWAAFVHDKFTEPPFPNLKWQGGKHADFILASEVFEHLPYPAQDLDELFRLRPSFVYVRTTRYQNESSNWFYLSPETGQHIFFFSDEAMKMVGRKYGYEVFLPSTEDAIFSKTPISATLKLMVRAILSHNFRRLKLAAAGL